MSPVAFLVATLTLFSGFELGTLLTRHREPTGARILATLGRGLPASRFHLTLRWVPEDEGVGG